MRANETRNLPGATPPGGVDPVRRSDEKVPAQRAEAAEAAPPVDRVSTAASAELQAAIRRARREAGALRAEQLAAIEAAVRDGTYRADAARIADRILEDAELIARLHAMLRR